MKCLRWLPILLLLIGSGTASGWDGNKVLQISPRDVPPLAGTRIKSLRVAALRDGALVPVPFQIDENNTAGLVWFPATGVPLNGREGEFDGDDRLLMLAADLSAQPLPPGFALPAGYRGEVAVTLQGETRYLQVIEGDFPVSDKLYVRHDIAKGTTETPFYSLEVDPANELNWRYLTVRSWRGNRQDSVVDTLKMRISGGVFSRFTRLTLDNDNLRPRLVGSRAGPLRSTVQLETAVVFGGVTVMKMQVQVLRYPHHFEARTHARIPKMYKMALVDPEVRVTIDGNNLKGAVTRTARGGSLQGITDGVIDNAEKQLRARGLSSDEDWILFDSRSGFAVLTFLDVPPELRGIPLQLVYEDAPDVADKPERVRGQSPNLGYGIRGFPPGEDFRFGVTLAFDKDLSGVDPQSYVSQWRERPAYRFRPASSPLPASSPP